MLYQTNAVLQKIIAQKLVKFASTHTNLHSKSILDVGSGTGFIAQNLVQIGVKPSSILQVDINPEALSHATQFGNVSKADFNQPLALNQQFSIILSSMALQWAEDLYKTLTYLQNFLIEGGSIFFAIPLQESLQEIYDILEITSFPFSTMEDIMEYAHIIHAQTYAENSYIALKNIHISNLVLQQNTYITKNKLILLKKATTTWNVGFFKLK
jgi:ubiquinone/menaquinone biosynthesis C-methylase UbiE